ncbi:hypothetical protein [Actinophytocola sediminis]
MFECEKWVWQVSGYDDRVHAFRPVDVSAGYLEAACRHSVPIGRVSTNHQGTRCVACLLIMGGRLTDDDCRFRVVR